MSDLFRRIVRRFQDLRSRDATGADAEPLSPEQHRRDMIYIWTELHGVPQERAEAMYEAYERATAAASMGLRGK